VFKGYYTKKTGGKKVTKNTKVKKSVTFYAHWTAKEYTLKFDANGGTVATASKKVRYKSKYGTLPTATKTGHKLKGWYKEKTGDAKVTADAAMPAANVTLYAQWEAVPPPPDSDPDPGPAPPEQTKYHLDVTTQIYNNDMLNPGKSVGDGDYVSGAKIYVGINNYVTHPQVSVYCNVEVSCGYNAEYPYWRDEIPDYSILGPDFQKTFTEEYVMSHDSIGTYIIMPDRDTSVLFQFKEVYP
jgi:uncharacterized repeat protein (TIGR02543 family)